MIQDTLAIHVKQCKTANVLHRGAPRTQNRARRPTSTRPAPTGLPEPSHRDIQSMCATPGLPDTSPICHGLDESRRRSVLQASGGNVEPRRTGSCYGTQNTIRWLGGVQEWKHLQVA